MITGRKRFKSCKEIENYQKRDILLSTKTSNQPVTKVNKLCPVNISGLFFPDYSNAHGTIIFEQRVRFRYLLSNLKENILLPEYEKNQHIKNPTIFLNNLKQK